MDTSSISSGNYSSQPKSDLGVVQQSEQIQGGRLKFDTEFADLLRRRSSGAQLLFVFIARSLHQFNLVQNYDKAFILNEAYIRGVERIATGEVIRNPTAWLRVTAYNIIRELSREHQKSAPLEEDIPDAQPSVSSVDLEDDLATLRMAFQLLTPHNQRWLNLKIVENRSWKEIRNILRLEGVGDFPETALRKRKERALIRLRKKYHAIQFRVITAHPRTTTFTSLVNELCSRLYPPSFVFTEVSI